MSVSNHISNKQIIDERVLHDIRDLMEADFPGLVERFIADAGSLLDEIEDALAQDDAGRVHRAAHTLKASSASLGAIALSECAKVFETMGRSGHLDGAADQFATAREQYRLVTELLEQRLRDDHPNVPSQD